MLSSSSEQARRTGAAPIGSAGPAARSERPSRRGGANADRGESGASRRETAPDPTLAILAAPARRYCVSWWKGGSRGPVSARDRFARKPRRSRPLVGRRHRARSNGREGNGDRVLHHALRRRRGWPYPFRTNHEVDALLEVPIDALTAPDALEVEQRRLPDGSFVAVYHYHFEGHDIWGITGQLIKEFLELIE